MGIFHMGWIDEYYMNILMDIINPMNIPMNNYQMVIWLYK